MVDNLQVASQGLIPLTFSNSHYYLQHPFLTREGLMATISDWNKIDAETELEPGLPLKILVKAYQELNFTLLYPILTYLLKSLKTLQNCRKNKTKIA